MAKRTRLMLSVLALAPSCLLLSSVALAVPPADEAAADVLFNQATDAAKAGRLDEACPKFAEAQRLDPTAGTLLNLGKCEEERHNLATAYGAYIAAEALARQDNDKSGREARAQAAVARIEPKLSMLVLTVAQGSRVEGIMVKRNGKAVGEGQWGSAIPVDPGAITIEVSAPGRLPWTTTVQIESRPGPTTIAVPALALAPMLPPTPTADTSMPIAREPQGTGNAWNGQKLAAVTVAGAGLVGIAVGTVFGVMTISKKRDSEANCRADDPTRCNATGVSLRGDEKTAGTISTISFVAGGVALAGGVVLFLTAPGRAVKPSAAVLFEALPAVAGGDLGLTLRARW